MKKLTLILALCVFPATAVAKEQHTPNNSASSSDCTKKEAIAKTVVNKPGPKPYKERSSISGFGYFIDEGTGQGGGVGGRLKLLRSWGKYVSRFEYKLDGFKSAYYAGGSYSGFASNTNLLLGISTGTWMRFKLLGGLSYDFMLVRGLYDYDLQILETALKAMVLARMDTKWVSVEVRAAVGGGARVVDRLLGLFRAEGLLQFEGHLGWRVDLVLASGFRYDVHTERARLFNTGAERHTSAFGRGCVQLNFRHGISSGVCMEAGQRFIYKETTPYIQPTLDLSLNF